MTIKAQQVAGVTTLVVLVVAVLSALHLGTVAQLSLQETVSRGEMLGHAIFQRARAAVEAGTDDPYRAIREDGGVRSLLESSIAYSANVTYAAVVDPEGTAIAHSFATLEGSLMEPQADLREVVAQGALAQFRAVYDVRTFEVRQPVLFDDQEGSIRIGVSTLLVRSQLQEALDRAGQTILIVLLISTAVAMALAQWMLKPIHVIQSGLSRLGRGELDVTLDLPGQEFRALGSSFEAVSAQLAAVRNASAAGPPSDFESVMESLEDAVALFSPSGEVIFSNAAMRTLLDNRVDTARTLPDDVRSLVERTLAGRHSQGPVSLTFGADEAGERLLMSHAIADTSGRFLGSMLVARNVGYLTHVHSTLNYSSKLAALGRLMAGVAHEVKNPLNAMTIHLELLKQKLAASREPVTVPAGAGSLARPVDLGKHVNVIAQEIRRLDEVVNGFLKFVRPAELRLQPTSLDTIISDVVTTVASEAEQAGVVLRTECPESLPDINADPAMLGQALLNLALNGCQAMPDGGTLRIACRAASRRRVEIVVEDTGVGIAPDDLGRIFDLYFTTKKTGTGIGLSMVYRIVQLHDGEIEVQSTPGHGTRFRLLFPQA